MFPKATIALVLAYCGCTSSTQRGKDLLLNANYVAYDAVWLGAWAAPAGQVNQRDCYEYWGACKREDVAK
jgi:hypothetical protein